MKLNETLWACPGMPDQTQQKLCNQTVALKKLTSYLKWFLIYKGLQILKSDWRISFQTATQKQEFYQVWGKTNNNVAFQFRSFPEKNNNKI